MIAAGAVLDRLEREMVVHPDLARAQADLARGWINYGLHLFSNSKAHLYDRKYPGNFNGDVSTSGRILLYLGYLIFYIKKFSFKTNTSLCLFL